MLRWFRRVFAAAVLAGLAALSAPSAQADVPVWTLSTTGAYAAATCGTSCVDGWLNLRVRDTLTDGSCVDVWSQPLWSGAWQRVAHWCSGSYGYFDVPVPTFLGYVEIVVCRTAYGNCSHVEWTQP